MIAERPFPVTNRYGVRQDWIDYDDWEEDIELQSYEDADGWNVDDEEETEDSEDSEDEDVHLDPDWKGEEWECKLEISIEEAKELVNKLEPAFFYHLPLYSQEDYAVRNSVDQCGALRKFILGMSPHLNYDIVDDAIIQYLETMVKLTIINSSNYGDFSRYAKQALAKTTRLNSLLENIMGETLPVILDAGNIGIFGNLELNQAIEEQIDELIDQFDPRNLFPYSDSDVISDETKPQGGSSSQFKNPFWNAKLPSELIEELNDLEKLVDPYDLSILYDDDYHGTNTAYVLARHYCVPLDGFVHGVPIKHIAAEYQDTLRRIKHKPCKTYQVQELNAPADKLARTAYFSFKHHNLELDESLTEFAAPPFTAIELWDEILIRFPRNKATHISIAFYRGKSQRHIGIQTIDRRCSRFIPHTNSDREMSLAIGSIVGFGDQPRDYSKPETYTLSMPNPRLIPFIDFACRISKENQILVVSMLQGLRTPLGHQTPWALLQTDNSYHAVLANPIELCEAVPTWTHILEVLATKLNSAEATEIALEISRSLRENGSDLKRIKRHTLPLIISHAGMLNKNPELRHAMIIDLGHLAYFLDNFYWFMKGEEENAGFLRITPRHPMPAPTLLAASPRLLSYSK